MCSFNSIVVRLKEGRPASLLEIASKFQFHSGSIKSVEVPHQGRGVSPFQFHSGSIKSPARPQTKGKRHEFQFHSGSIKSDLFPC